MTHPPFWLPALARPQIWRTALGLVIIMAVWFLGTFVVLFGAARALDRPVEILALGADPVAAAVFFFSFIGFLVGLALVLRLLHGRRFRTLLGPSGKFDIRQFRIGAAVTLGVAALLSSLMIVERQLFPPDMVPGFRQAQPVGAWALTLIPALALIFLQTFAEEAVFRGYLLQQLRARFRSVLVWAVAPSLLFGLMHFNAGSYGVVNASAYVLNATVMGTLAALVTVRTGNLSAAAGLHFGNNASLIIVGIAGQLDGFSLYTVQMPLRSGYTTYSILMQTGAMALAFFVWWRWMARNRPIANAPDAA